MDLLSAAVNVAMLLLLVISVRLVDYLESENALDEAEIESSRIYQASLSTRVEQVRRYRHDADALLRAIERAAGDEAGQIASDKMLTPPMLSDGENALFDESRFPLSNAAVELQRQRCADEGIPFTVAIDGLSGAWADGVLDDSDLCLVLQNLLDNAFEASIAPGELAIPVGERAISLHVGSNQPDGLLIEVGNRTADDVPPEFRTGKADPELHGVGIQVVEDIARKHGGSLVPSFDPATRVLTMAVRLK